MAFADYLPALPWLAPFLSLLYLSRREPDLVRARRARGRLVSVVIPARNEAASITTVVTSLLASSYEPLEVLVVDDRSTDTTAEVVERLAAADPRLRLIQGAELPAGWYGKPWACVQGYRAAGGDIVLFVDADTRHAPALLEHAVGALEDEAADLLTISPHQLCLTFWERLVMPQIWLLLGLRYHPRAVNRATRPRDIIANGQFIMMTRAAYEAAGTHEAVRHEVAEDLALAQTFLRHRLKVYFAFAQRLMETRMYQSLPHLIEGWSKNVYLGGRQSFPDEPIRRALVPVILVAAISFWLIPPVIAGVSLTTGALGDFGTPALLATGLSAVFWVLVSVGMGIPAWYGLGYPLGALVALYIVARSTWRGRRKVEWRGRVYEGGTAGVSTRDG